jgi:hypothetical protein
MLGKIHFPRSIIALCILTLAPAAASASLHLSAVGGISMANQTISYDLSPYSTTQKNYLSYGLLASVRVPKSIWGLSSGILYSEFGSHQRSSVGVTTTDIDQKLPYYVIPITIDFWLGQYISIGLGAFYATAAGNMSDKGADVTGGVSNPIDTSRSFSDNNYESKDFGYLARLQIYVPIKKRFFITATGIYALGTTDIDKDQTLKTTNRSILALAGVGLVF